MPGTTLYPGALDSHTGGNPLGFAELENLKYTSLSVDVNASTGSVDVLSTAGFPTRGSFAVGTEIITYTGLSGGVQFTGCVRGVDGTTAAAHAAGATVGIVYVAANHNDLAAAIVAIETKLGTGADVAAANEVLKGTGAGTTEFGSIATANIAANAVTQSGHAVGSSVSPSTTSASYADMPDMAVTLTTTGGDLLVWFESTLNLDTLAVAGVFGLSLDAAAEVAERAYQTASASSFNAIAIVYRFTGVSAASHTVKVRWKSNGTASLLAYVRQRSLLVVELKR